MQALTQSLVLIELLMSPASAIAGTQVLDRQPTSDDLATSALLGKLNSFLDSKFSNSLAALELNENLEDTLFLESSTILNKTIWGQIRLLASNPDELKGTTSFNHISRANALLSKLEQEHDGIYFSNEIFTP